MADYISITDAQIEPKAPVTSELMNQLRDNPLAIAEGSNGAPKVAKTTKVGSVSTGGGSATTGGLADFSGILLDIFHNTDGLGGATDITLSFSNNGSTFYGATIIGTAGPDEFLNIKVAVDFASAAYRLISGGAGVTAQSQSGSISGLSSSVTHFRLTSSNGSMSYMAHLDGGDSSYV